MTIRLGITLLLAALVGSLAGCSLFGTDDVFPGDAENEVGIYEGRFAQGFEDSPFEPCGLDETWLITFEGDDAVGRDFIERVTAVTRHANPMYVRLRGVPSPKGEYPGIFISYDRRFTLVEVLEVRAPRIGDCR